LGPTPQLPLWRAYQQSEKRVQQWLDEEYPAIQERARKENARIFFADEAGLRSDHHAGTAYGPPSDAAKAPPLSSDVMLEKR